MSNIVLEINQNVARIIFDLENEKVNKLSFEILKEFDEKLNIIKDDSSRKALVINNEKKEKYCQKEYIWTGDGYPKSLYASF